MGSVGHQQGIHFLMDSSSDFPRLTSDNHQETSPAAIAYNCIAWAVEDTQHWWQPGVYWLPDNWPVNDFGLGALERVFRTLGYEDCGMDEKLEVGSTKVALFASSSFIYTHAARQLPSGKWTSKLGKDIDIEHDSPAVVAGGVYGEVMQVMKRQN
jgi:hypothetical protein